MTSFGRDVLLTYKHVKYMSFFSKLTTCFYCKSKCCNKLPKSIFEEYDYKKKDAQIKMISLLEEGKKKSALRHGIKNAKFTNFE